jgi:hypothetical protein
MQIRYERAFHRPAPVVEDAVRGPELSTPADSVVTVLPARIRSSLHLYPREGRRVQGFGSAEFDCLSYLVNLSIAGVTADFELLILSGRGKAMQLSAVMCSNTFKSSRKVLTVCWIWR